MRFLALLNLFFYIMLNLHTSFDGHVQVLCVEKDGHATIETFDLTKLITGNVVHDENSKQGICCPEHPGQCDDCTDYYIGNGHPDSQGVLRGINPNIQAINSLIQLPSLLPEPFLTAWSPSLPVSHPPLLLPDAKLVHIPSTVLLI